jgi:hypothetical protein
MSLFDSLFGYIDLKARGEIRDLRATLSKERLEGADVRQALEMLAGRLERQGLVLEALLALLSKQGITEEAILQQVARLAEERSAPAQPKNCLHCGMPLRQMRNRCVYCGMATPADSPVKSL